MLIPTESGGAGGLAGLGGLAAMAGISIGGGGSMTPDVAFNSLLGNYDFMKYFVEKNGGTVATMDRELKSKIKEVGGSVLSIHNDKIVLES